MKDFLALLFWGSATALSFAITYFGFKGMRGYGDEVILGVPFFVIGGGLLAACLSKVIKRVRKSGKTFDNTNHKSPPSPSEFLPEPKKQTSFIEFFKVGGVFIGAFVVPGFLYVWLRPWILGIILPVTDRIFKGTHFYSWLSWLKNPHNDYWSHKIVTGILDLSGILIFFVVYIVLFLVLGVQIESMWKELRGKRRR
ncbi:MAG: hypothetical protein RX318_10390 [bacterium]|nr:hypothetical protein [bacterium]